MARTIDWKSFLFGVLASLALMACLGAEDPADLLELAKTESAPASQVGRYQIAAAGHQNGTVGYVVDTVTGQVWNSNAGGFASPKNRSSNPGESQKGSQDR